MDINEIKNSFQSLPEDLQREAADFISFLHTRISSAGKSKKHKKISFVNQPFVGMWADRKDMADSVQWVKDLRATEWESNND